MCQGGIAAASIAQEGITGARNCLEGEAGLYKVYHHGDYNRMDHVFYRDGVNDTGRV